jgi:antirestriction protein ArdC
MTTSSKTSSPLLATLENGIADLTREPEWKAWLDMQAKLYKYSFFNCVLIAIQRPEATSCAGFRQWQTRHNRVVRNGEKAIWILAPVFKKIKVVVKDETTGEEREETREVLSFFKSVKVFDLDQTDGPALPEPCNPLQGDDAGLYASLEAYAHQAGYSVAKEAMGSAHGYCNPRSEHIGINDADSPAQQAKSLAHEIGHAILHGTDFDMSRADAELEAESVAYIVCQHFGLDTARYSFEYITWWQGQAAKDVQEGLRASGQRISNAAKKVIAGVENNMVTSAPAAAAAAIPASLF